MSYTNPQIKFIVLASGTGTLFHAIAQACQNHQLNAQIISLVCDRDNAPVIEKAQTQHIPVKIFSVKDYSSVSHWDQAMCSYLKTQKPDLILLAGFVKKIEKEVLCAFENKILNIHPSLLPLYGGNGMYGIHVHKAVLAAGDKYTGISIHIVSENYDSGSILAQKKIPVFPQDTPQSLQKRVKKEEQAFYISTLREIIKKQEIV